MTRHGPGRDDAEGLLADIAEQITVCQDLVADGREEFMGDGRLSYMRRRTAERALEIIAEAARRLDPSWRAEHPEVPWREMRDMRNKIAHDYGEIDYGLVWEVISVNIPQVGRVLGLAEVSDPYTLG